MSSHEKAFCLGFSKTGTTSMEVAFETLGYNVCKGHWANNHTFYIHGLSVNRDYAELLRMADYWDAFADGPWGGTDLYLHLVQKYPNAHYILTERDPDSWYASFEKLIMIDDLNVETCFETYRRRFWGSGYFFATVFGIDTLAGNRQKIIDTYVAYNEQVKRFFADIKKPLLVMDLAKGDGWDLLCAFLQKPVPNLPYPRANTAESNPYLSNVVR